MTDDADKEKKNGKKSLPEGKPNVDPVMPRRQDLFDFLEQLFYIGDGVNYPEHIDVRIVKGKYGEVFGPQIMTRGFAPLKADEETLKKMPGRLRALPTKEELVYLTNAIVAKTQETCDQLRQPIRFGVDAYSLHRSEEPYERFLIRGKPSGRHSAEGEEGDDDADLAPRDRFVIQTLHQNKEMFGLTAGAWESFMDRDDRLIKRLLDRNEHLEKILETKNDQLERALSAQEDREQRREWNKMKVKSAEKALELGFQLAPPFLSSLTGRQIGGAQKSLESITLENFFKTLTPEQVSIIFGDEDEATKKIIKEGILTYAQGQILYGVASCQLPVNRLDDLLPGGASVITQEQFVGLQAKSGLQVEQYAPLGVLFQSRQAARSTSKGEN